MKKWLYALLPALVLGALLGVLALMPQDDTLVEASIADTLPVGRELPGWVGERTQESEAERSILAVDTKFAKANYRALGLDEWAPDPRTPLVDASIVFSGQDMNSSIHRPELCLPSQGFQNLQGQPTTVELSNGMVLPFTRLSSIRPNGEKRADALHFIHYYIFVGHGHIKSTHMQRVMQDMYDRLFTGEVERWAYFQVGCYWGGSSGITEEQADRHIRRLISVLLPRIIRWDEMK